MAQCHSSLFVQSRFSPAIFPSKSGIPKWGHLWPHRNVLLVSFYFLSGDRYRFRYGIAYPFIVGNSEGDRVISISAISMPGILPGAVLTIAKIPKPWHNASITISTAISKNSDCSPFVIAEINCRWMVLRNVSDRYILCVGPALITCCYHTWLIRYHRTSD